MRLSRRAGLVLASVLGSAAFTCSDLPQSSRHSAFALDVPYPSATSEDQVLANIVYYARQTHLVEATRMPQLRNEHNELRVRRQLDVKALWRRTDYFVLELDDASGRPLANAAIQKDGKLIGVEDLRPSTDTTRPVDLAGVSTRAAKYGHALIGSAKFVFAPNYAEPGSSPFRPLAAIGTTAGTLYVNSRGDEFAEEASQLVSKAKADPIANGFYPEGTLRLRQIHPH